MCGIAGVIGAPPVAAEPAVRRMMRAMVHRGPDDEGYEEFPASATGQVVGFGFRRLAILDLSPAGHQPMVHAGTGDCLIFNGEIYNFRDLRPRLQAHGCRFQSTGDAEVLLHALTTWGERVLEELDGMFAFAFYHAASRRVLLARDHLGIKPLYFAQTGGSVVFASEVRTVLASGLVPADLDPAGIAGFLAYGSPQDPLTVHRHVRSLPSGSCSWVDAGDPGRKPIVPRRYWAFPPVRHETDAAAVVSLTHDHLASSVRDQCVSDVPLGVFLSGGIDSATIAALARSPGQAVKTFAVGFEVPGGEDECAAAAATAMALGTNHFQTILDDEWLRLQWTQWLKAADRPSIDGLNTYVISGAVTDREITVSLSGLGADELFGGYPSFVRVPKWRRALALAGCVPRSIRRRAAEALARRMPASRREKFVDQVSGSVSLLELAIQSRRLSSDATLSHLGLRADELGLTSTYLPPEALQAFRTSGTDSFQVVSQTESLLYMGNTLLRDSDINGMAHSLEIRVPFLGRRFVEYVAGLPMTVKSPPQGRPKHLLREALKQTLPADVFTRPKRGFTLPFAEWMAGPLRDECEAAIDALGECEIFPTGSVQSLWRRYLDGRNGYQWSRPLSLVVLGSYLQKLSRIGHEVA